jgi:excisionase family DNA binding protein
VRDDIPKNPAPDPEMPRKALEVIAHIIYDLGLERDINAFRAGHRMGAWDFVRIALASPGNLEDVLGQIDNKNGAMTRPCAACSCCQGRAGELPAKGEILRDSLRDFHPDVLVERAPDNHTRETASEFLTLSEVCDLARMSAPTARRLIQDGKLRAHRLGDSANAPYRIRASDLDAYIDASLVRETR